MNKDAEVAANTKADRPTKQPGWRTNPSNAGDKKKLADYCTKLEDVVRNQQEQLEDCWKAFHRIKGYVSPELQDNISKFLSGQPLYRYTDDAPDDPPFPSVSAGVFIENTVDPAAAVERDPISSPRFPNGG